MTFAIIQLVIFHFVLPAIFIGLLIKGAYQSKLQWLLQVLAFTAYVVWIVLTGSWIWFSYYIRYGWIVLLLLSIYISWKKVSDLPLKKPFDRKQKFSTAVDIFLMTIFGFYIISALMSFSTTDKLMNVSFPLEDGKYYVFHGGSKTATNYHAVYEPQQYAPDVVGSTAFGSRASGLYPKDLEKYAIYGATLISPCAGEITEMRDNLPDLIPPNMDREHPEGNYVAIVCDRNDATLYIAHMQKGSVQVEVGEKVEVGQELGKVGNSGNTSEPHLHIHAEKDGVGIPLQFDGKFYVRNQIMKK